jgi:3-oxoacyl-[acyl-carrier protein] reductase
MTGPLTGKIALVTGGSRGLGAATVRALAAHGADVALSYVTSKDTADTLVEEITALGVRAAAFQADQADPHAAAALPGRVVDHFGGLDILVANASIDAFGRADDPDRDQDTFDRYWAVTNTGFMATVRAASRVIADDGRIIAIGSNHATRAGIPGVADNAASKAAIDGYTRGIARDLGHRRVTANVVHAGPMETDLTAGSRDMLASIIDGLCIQRFGTVQEVAAAIVFLAGPSAGFITGTTLDVDGGYNA